MRCPWAHWGGGEVRQLLEIGESDYSHTITTVDKDNYVLETDDYPESWRPGGQAWSIKDHAFTIPSNPMSDRVQLVIEIYETEDIPHRSHLEK